MLAPRLPSSDGALHDPRARPSARPYRDRPHRRRRRPRHRRALRHTVGGHGPECHGGHEPTPGHAGGARDHACRRQRHRRGDRSERGARPGRADGQWHRRGPLRDRLPRRERRPVRAERQRPLATVTDARLVRGERSRLDPALRPAARDRAWRRRRLVRAARSLRPAVHGTGFRTRDPLRPRRLPGERAGRALLEPQRADPVGVPWLHRADDGRRPRAARGRDLAQSEPGEHARDDRDRGPGRLLPR